MRYRGYYYDDDLDLYYLTTRYYDPEVRRFMTADSYVSTGQGILGHNMYTYCGNNPVTRTDPTGESWITIVILIALAHMIVSDMVLDSCDAGDNIEIYHDIEESKIGNVETEQRYLYFNDSVEELNGMAIEKSINAALYNEVGTKGNNIIETNAVSGSAVMSRFGCGAGIYLLDTTWNQTFEWGDKTISFGVSFKIGVGAEVLLGKKSALSATLGIGGGLDFAIVD